MLSPARNKVLLAVLGILAVSSLTLKAAMGPTVLAPPRTGPASVAGRVQTILSSQGFETSIRHLKIQSPIVFGQRGACTLSVRDASGGAATQAAYADDARRIGPVRYFYKGNSFSSPPMLRIHFAVIESSLLNSLGFQRDLHVPLALAASHACGRESFGLEDLELTISS